MDDAEIDKERGVIVEEWRLGLGADDRMMQKYLPVLFKGSRYADSLPIGKVEIIKTFPYDTLRSFYKTWYRPDLMAVVVVGDIDPKLAEEKVKEYFGRMPEPVDPKTRIEFSVPDNTEPLISVVTDKEASGFACRDNVQAAKVKLHYIQRLPEQSDAVIIYKHVEQPAPGDCTKA